MICERVLWYLIFSLPDNDIDAIPRHTPVAFIFMMQHLKHAVVLYLSHQGP